VAEAVGVDADADMLREAARAATTARITNVSWRHLRAESLPNELGTFRLATFAPEKFAERDRLWATGDPDYYALSDALQHLGNVAFRVPVPAYKHSAAHFLHLAGRIPSNRTHPKSASRPAWEGEMMKDCALRLGLLHG